MVDYNRFAYARNNPLKFSDPSGHIAICFSGGASTGEPSPDDAIQKMCGQLADKGLFDKNPWYMSGNTWPQILKQYQRILDAYEANPNEPVYLLGYSYGGGAAMELAKLLESESPDISVNVLVTIEPVNFGRRWIRSGQWATNELSGNVDKALNLWAGTPAEAERLPVDRFSFLPYDVSTPFINGQEKVENALNLEIAGRVSDVTTHFSIIYPETVGDEVNGYNGRTYNTVQTFMRTRFDTER